MSFLVSHRGDRWQCHLRPAFKRVGVVDVAVNPVGNAQCAELFEATVPIASGLAKRRVAGVAKGEGPRNVHQ